MKLDAVLTMASRLARRRKYEMAIRTLLPQVSHYYGSYRYYYLLGASCLHAGDFGNALTYLRLAYQVKKRDPLAILGLAALYLRRNETERAVDLYLEVLEIDPKNKIARKAMNIIRKHAGDESFSGWLERGKIHVLFPKIPFPGFSAKAVTLFIFLFLTLSTACLGLLLQFGIISFSGHSRPGIEYFYLLDADKSSTVVSEGEFNNINEAVRVYNKALEYFNNYNDELAKVELNRILKSNASQELKNKALIFKTDLMKNIPGFNTLKDSFSFSDVLLDPLLYDGVYVIWEGSLANLAFSENRTAFALLVDYIPPEKSFFRGEVPVVFNKAVPINEAAPIKVLGSIIINAENKIALNGLDWHQPISL